jgi:GDP-L-fucose synthase
MVGRNLVECLRLKHQLLTPSSKELNLLNKQQVKNYLNENRPNMVIHCAGVVGGIQANISNPVKFLVDNTQMGLNVIMTSIEVGVERLINLSSSCMYPREAINPLKEDYILKGELEPTNEGYALAKILTTRLCEYINKENNRCGYKTIIPCNLFGEFDKFDPRSSHMIPAVIKKIYEAKINNSPTVEIWGDGESRREFMFASDLADFIEFMIDNFDRVPQNINIGLGKDYSINEYYKVIAEVIGYEGEFIHDLSKPTGMKQKLIDDSKIKELGWKHKTNLKKGIRKTLDYYISTQNHD